MHVGKEIPTTPLWHIKWLSGSVAVSPPPRYVWFEQSGIAPIGSVPLQWDDLAFLSEPVVPLLDGSPGWRYVWINPNNTDLTLQLDTSLEEFSPADPTAMHYRLRPAGGFYDGLDRLWQPFGTLQLPLVWGNASWGGFIANNQPPVPLADWTELQFSLRCGRWTDNPDYHPYRH